MLDLYCSNGSSPPLKRGNIEFGFCSNGSSPPSHLARKISPACTSTREPLFATFGSFRNPYPFQAPRVESATLPKVCLTVPRAGSEYWTRQSPQGHNWESTRKCGGLWSENPHRLPSTPLVAIRNIQSSRKGGRHNV